MWGGWVWGWIGWRTSGLELAAGAGVEDLGDDGHVLGGGRLLTDGGRGSGRQSVSQ